MNAEEFKEKLVTLNACIDARNWATGKTLHEAWESCDKSDWLLWLYAKVHPDNYKELKFAIGHCTNTVRHLMEDDRSTNAVDISIKFGAGKATKEELSIAADGAHSAYMCYLPSNSQSFSAWAAAAAYAASSLYSSPYDAALHASTAIIISDNNFVKNELQRVELCRKHLSSTMFTKNT